MQDVLERLAEAVDGTFHPRDHRGRPVVQCRKEGRIITLNCWRTDGGWRTSIGAPFFNPRRFRFFVTETRAIDRFWKKLGIGGGGITVGDEAFDRRFQVRGRPAAMMRELLDERSRALLLAQDHVSVWVARNPVDSSDTPLFPPGVEKLRVIAKNRASGTEALLNLFQVFTRILAGMAPLDPRRCSDPALLVERLTAPGGTVRGTHGPMITWDGDEPRRAAALRLGELGLREAVPHLLSVLDDDDEVLRARAIEALGRIGDRRAVPALVERLGDPCLESAGPTLESFGLENLPSAFRSALEGDPQRLKEEVGEHREGVIERLVEFVQSGSLHVRPHAARALGALGAGEALPALRSASKALGMRTRLTEAASEAIEKIERGARLPRPAQGAPPVPDTLPRPSGPDV